MAFEVFLSEVLELTSGSTEYVEAIRIYSTAKNASNSEDRDKAWKVYRQAYKAENNRSKR